MARNDKNILVENARIGFLNFAGKAGKYNAKGKRNFCVFFDEAMAAKLAKDGWNIKKAKDREIDGEIVPGDHYLQVDVQYRNREDMPIASAPRIVTIGSSSRRRQELTEDTCEILDDLELENVDCEIRPYEWDWDGDKGITAKLAKMYVVVVEDYLDLKYAEEG
jgi:hypothetical protein